MSAPQQNLAWTVEDFPRGEPAQVMRTIKDTSVPIMAVKVSPPGQDSRPARADGPKLMVAVFQEVQPPPGGDISPELAAAIVQLEDQVVEPITSGLEAGPEGYPAPDVRFALVATRAGLVDHVRNQHREALLAQLREEELVLPDTSILVLEPSGTASRPSKVPHVVSMGFRREPDGSLADPEHLCRTIGRIANYTPPLPTLPRRSAITTAGSSASGAATATSSHSPPRNKGPGGPG